MHDFITAIRNGRAPKVDLHEATEAVRMGFAVYKSSRTGKSVPLSA